MKDGKYVILYVDDDQDMLDSLRIVLEANGYLMEEALSAEEGLGRYQACRPDFVILDLMMEEVDAGAHLAKDLKALQNQKPVYLLSSVGDQLHQTVDSVALGLTGVFQKPIKFDVLLATLKQKLK
jgi:DNA-binding response OmpR family regulator